MKFFWYSMLYILSGPGTCDCENIAKVAKNENIVEGGYYDYNQTDIDYEYHDKCNLTQPIAFKTWSDFQNECGDYWEIKENPTNQVTVHLSLKPTRLLNVDPDKHVRNNVIEYWARI